jgi:hypothetical protein
MLNSFDIYRDPCQRDTYMVQLAQRTQEPDVRRLMLQLLNKERDEAIKLRNSERGQQVLPDLESGVIDRDLIT